MGIEKKYEQQRMMLLRYINELAHQKGITQQEIAERCGWHQSHVSRMMAGKFPPTLDNFLKYAEAIGVRLELHAPEAKSSNLAKNSATPKFLIAPDVEGGQLYIMHTQFPACLIHIVQTIPASFMPVGLYDDVENVSEVVEEAKAFYRGYVESMDGNS